MKTKKPVVTTETLFQPRILCFPDNPIHSTWFVAVNPDEIDNDGNFDNYDDAYDALIKYCEEHKTEKNSAMIAVITTTYINIP